MLPGLPAGPAALLIPTDLRQVQRLGGRAGLTSQASQHISSLHPTDSNSHTEQYCHLKAGPSGPSLSPWVPRNAQLLLLLTHSLIPLTNNFTEVS